MIDPLAQPLTLPCGAAQRPGSVQAFVAFGGAQLGIGQPGNSHHGGGGSAHSGGAARQPASNAAATSGTSCNERHSCNERVRAERAQRGTTVTPGTRLPACSPALASLAVCTRAAPWQVHKLWDYFQNFPNMDTSNMPDVVGAFNFTCVR